MAQANREIGVAKAAFFPRVELGSTAVSKITASILSSWRIASGPMVSGFPPGLRWWLAAGATSTLLVGLSRNRRQVSDDRPQRVPRGRRRLKSDEQIERLRKEARPSGRRGASNAEFDNGSLQGRVKFKPGSHLCTGRDVDGAYRLGASKDAPFEVDSRPDQGARWRWQRGRMPNEDEIQPFDTFQYQGIKQPAPAGGTGVPLSTRAMDNDLTRTSPAL